MRTIRLNRLLCVFIKLTQKWVCEAKGISGLFIEGCGV